MSILPLTFAHVEEATRVPPQRVSEPVPDVAIVLGSGLGAFAESLGQAVTLPYETIPHWPASRVVGHAGTLVAGHARADDGCSRCRAARTSTRATTSAP